MSFQPEIPQLSRRERVLESEIVEALRYNPIDDLMVTDMRLRALYLRGGDRTARLRKRWPLTLNLSLLWTIIWPEATVASEFSRGGVGGCPLSAASRGFLVPNHS